MCRDPPRPLNKTDAGVEEEAAAAADHQATRGTAAALSGSASKTSFCSVAVFSLALCQFMALFSQVSSESTIVNFLF
jgi:hypothetical protein